MPASDFTTTLGAVASVEGWMTDAQARRLWDASSALRPPATIVEIGSFQGRSTIVLATAAAPGVEVVAIDPHAGNDRGPQELEGFADAARGDHDAFVANLEAAGVRHRVRHLRAFSSDALADVAGEIDVLYIDGAHRYRPALEDIRRWGERVRDGGTLLVHDSFSSVGVTLAILSSLLLDGRFTYVGRSASLAEYRRNPPLSRRGNAGRQLAQLPWFARNVVLKALIVTKLRKGDWPY
ncbi:MAG TPA: class I SAM-dependent methyltransferase [Acidimicrobiales bacterium]|nr:class I SAM-dependent methyltransferase [Acidimicrobiales bacterium]